MAELPERTRRILSFPQRDEGKVCALCCHPNVRMSMFPSWKDMNSQQYALSLGIEAESPICRLCRDDISRLVKNPSSIPRWGKNKTHTLSNVLHSFAELFSQDLWWVSWWSFWRRCRCLWRCRRHHGLGVWGTLWRVQWQWGHRYHGLWCPVMIVCF